MLAEPVEERPRVDAGKLGGDADSTLAALEQCAQILGLGGLRHPPAEFGQTEGQPVLRNSELAGVGRVGDDRSGCT